MRVCLFAVLDGRRLHELNGAQLHAPAPAERRFGSQWSVSAPCRDTALHLASTSGHTESVKALLEKGADVNAEDYSRCAFVCLLCWTGVGCTS